MRGKNKAMKRYLRKQRKNVIDPKAVRISFLHPSALPAHCFPHEGYTPREAAEREGTTEENQRCSEGDTGRQATKCPRSFPDLDLLYSCSNGPWRCKRGRSMMYNCIAAWELPSPTKRRRVGSTHTLSRIPHLTSESARTYAHPPLSLIFDRRMREKWKKKRSRRLRRKRRKMRARSSMSRFLTSSPTPDRYCYLQNKRLIMGDYDL